MMLNDYNAGLPALGRDVSRGGNAAKRKATPSPLRLVDSPAIILILRYLASLPVVTRAENRRSIVCCSHSYPGSVKKKNWVLVVEVVLSCLCSFEFASI